MSKKYIIEIEEEPFIRKSALHGEEAIYRAKGFKSLVFDKNGINMLTPYEDNSEKTRGKWDTRYPEFDICSNCGAFIPKTFPCKFCPDCGSQNKE